jgi:hypothetical protein
MRRHLAADRGVRRAGAADRGEAVADGDVRDVEPRLRQGRELDVAGDHGRLGDGGPAGEAEARRGPPLVHLAAPDEVRVLLVDDDREVEHRGVLEGTPHQVGVHDGLPVVGDRDDPLGLHQADLGEGDALLPLRDGPIGRTRTRAVSRIRFCTNDAVGRRRSRGPCSACSRRS